MPKLPFAARYYTQAIHIQKKRLYWEKEQRWVSIKLSVKALRTIKKKGLDSVAEEYGVDLYSLPYKDVSDARLQWKAAHPARPPMPKNPRCDHAYCSSELQTCVIDWRESGGKKCARI
jgi:Ribosomal L28 family